MKHVSLFFLMSLIFSTDVFAQEACGVIAQEIKAAKLDNSSRTVSRGNSCEEKRIADMKQVRKDYQAEFNKLNLGSRKTSDGNRATMANALTEPYLAKILEISKTGCEPFVVRNMEYTDLDRAGDMSEAGKAFSEKIKDSNTKKVYGNSRIGKSVHVYYSKENKPMAYVVAQYDRSKVVYLDNNCKVSSVATIEVVAVEPGPGYLGKTKVATPSLCANLPDSKGPVVGSFMQNTNRFNRFLQMHGSSFDIGPHFVSANTPEYISRFKFLCDEYKDDWAPPAALVNPELPPSTPAANRAD